MDLSIQTLPPQDTPKQLTVKDASKTLQEHFVMFLNANNIQGYLKDENYTLTEDVVGDILLIAAASEGLSLDEMKRLSHRIKAITNKQISNSLGLEFLARALGYPTYKVCRLCLSEDRFAKNVWRGFDKAHRTITNIDDFRIETKNPEITKLLESFGRMNRIRSAIKKRKVNN